MLVIFFICFMEMGYKMNFVLVELLFIGFMIFLSLLVLLINEMFLLVFRLWMCKIGVSMRSVSSCVFSEWTGCFLLIFLLFIWMENYLLCRYIVILCFFCGFCVVVSCFMEKEWESWLMNFCLESLLSDFMMWLNLSMVILFLLIRNVRKYFGLILLVFFLSVVVSWVEEVDWWWLLVMYSVGMLWNSLFIFFVCFLLSIYSLCFMRLMVENLYLGFGFVIFVRNLLIFWEGLCESSIGLVLNFMMLR